MAETISNTPGKKPVADGTVEQSESQYIKYLRENGLKNLEKLDLTLFLGGHTSAVDADDLLKHLNGIDILILEMAAHNRQTESMLNSITSGQTSVKSRQFLSPFLQRIANRLENSRVCIGTADIPADSRVGRIASRAYKKWSKVVGEIAQRHLERSAAKIFYLQTIQNFAHTVPARERYFASQIGPTIIRLLENERSRADRKSLSTLIFMGGGHVGLSSLLTERHPTTSVINASLNSYPDEVIQKSIRGEIVPDNLIDNALTEETIRALMGVSAREQTGRFSEQQMLLKNCLNAMDIQKREELHSLIINNNVPGALIFLQRFLPEGLLNVPK